MPSRLSLPIVEQRRLMGRRIRRRRLSLGLSQQRFADALGVSRQQVLKYEHGAQAISPERMREILHVLRLKPRELSPGIGVAAVSDANGYEDFIASAEGVALYRALSAIPDKAARKRIIRALLVVGESLDRPEDKDVKALAGWLGTVLQGNGAARLDDVTDSLRALRTELAQRVGRILKARHSTQKRAGELLRVDQARISALSRGDIRAVSLEKLLRHLAMLGWSLTIAVRRAPAEQPPTVELRFDGEEPN